MTGKLPEQLDVLVIGAGISGIDAAYHLTTYRPAASFAVVESKPELGGTWATHSFPGIRSDSDLYTFGFSWKPWTGPALAEAHEIRSYLVEAVEEQGLGSRLFFERTVTSARWSSETHRWTVEITGADGHELVSCRFLWVCAGYFRHDRGHIPEIAGQETFCGPIIHPQTWPDRLDYTGKRVVVVGSGATAATLVPTMARDTASLTVLQRSPSYYYARPTCDPFAEQLRELDLPDEWFHEIMRRKSLCESQALAERARSDSEGLRRELLFGVQMQLGKDADIAPHFTPAYRPWQQRLALVPDGDLFKAIKAGQVEMVTDQIERITPTGINLVSGRAIGADIIVLATGLELNFLGDIVLEVDGASFFPQCSVTHRGIMFTGLPNLALVFGYLRSSWTLRADLVSRYLIRLLAHMDATGASSVVPELGADEGMPRRPWVEPENFNPGYITRALDRLPKQGTQQPWLMTQDYFQDREDLPKADLEDGSLIYR